MRVLRPEGLLRDRPWRRHDRLIIIWTRIPITCYLLCTVVVTSRRRSRALYCIQWQSCSRGTRPAALYGMRVRLMTSRRPGPDCSRHALIVPGRSTRTCGGLRRRVRRSLLVGALQGGAHLHPARVMSYFFFLFYAVVDENRQYSFRRF